MACHPLKLIGGDYSLKRVTIFIGNYGSGKTEVAVNFALALAGKKSNVSIVDLDVVNPYFRCREAGETLEAAGVETVFPKGEYTWADLPIILPEVKGVLENKDRWVVLDAGGDDVGARVLASLSDSLDISECEVLFVLNISRPFTDHAEGAIKMIEEVGAAGGLPVTGLVINPHLTNETTPEVVYRGVEMAEAVSKKTNIPVRFLSATRDVIKDLDIALISHLILPMERQMLPPWETKG